MKNKFLNLTLIFCILIVSLITAYPTYAYTEFLPTGFWNDPADPSTFDTVAFGLDGSPPPEWQCNWDFGDGTTSSDLCWNVQYKRYQNDGDYTVNVQVSSGYETVTLSRMVSLRTHDVAITKFTVPQSARAGQTRQIAVYVRNSRYPENVAVDLFKSITGGYQFIGESQQLVPVRPVNRTTAFTFNYTFTAEDVYIGKVTFRAEAILLDARDAWLVDNEAISLPTRVSK